MSRTPEEIYAEIAAWPLAERLRLAARILEEAARLAEAGEARRQEEGREQRLPPAGRGAPDAGGAAARPQPSVPGRQAPAARTPAAAVPPSTPVASPPATPRSLVIVDGSNFLGTVAGFDLASDASREELILRLQEFARDHPSFRLVAYFDGQKTTVRRAAGVEVRFTPRERPADFFILQALRALGEAERQRALLVTADRTLADSARKLGAKVEAPTSLHRRLPGAKRTAVSERGLSASEVADWEEYFRRPPDEGQKRGKK